MKKHVAILLISSLAGCANFHSPIPEGYSGPRATLKDTVRVLSNTQAEFFYVSHIDAQPLESSVIRTRTRNRGLGAYMTPVVLQHEIPARPLKLSVVGATEWGAPLLAMTGHNYEVKGDVEFTPEPNKTYAVRGELSKTYSAVWIEEDATKAMVSPKIELKGSAK